jgi:hypothetical protein
VLIDRDNWALHRPWVVLAVLGAVAASVWYFMVSATADSWPGGSSVPGFTFGILGGAICLFEMLLWWRKKVRTWRIGRAQVWLRAHIWLGLLSVPLLVFHSGFRFGGPLSTVLMVLFLVVIGSGVWGLILQQLLPKTMLHEVPAETIYSQIDRIVAQGAAESERLVLATCGPEPGATTAAAAAEEEEAAATGFLTIGAVRIAGSVQGKVLQTRVPSQPVPGTEALRSFFVERVRPYLLHGNRSDSPLRYPARSAGLFRNLRTLLPEAATSAVDVLEGAVHQRRELDRQARLHFWMHNWLWFHLPLAAALIVLMLIHTFVAVKYW